MKFFSLSATSSDYRHLFTLFSIPIFLGGVYLFGMVLSEVAQGPTEVRFVGPVASGELITSDLPGLVEFAVFTDRDHVADLTCRNAAGERTDHFPQLPQGELTRDGARWVGAFSVVKVKQGESVSCTVDGGPSQVLLVHRAGRERLFKAFWFGTPGLIGISFGLIGGLLAVRDRRAKQRREQYPAA